ncbi:hypothetical protein [Rhodopirellula baltica]|nr:hypothetical protein [Rhodopirellula baltica]
MKLVWSAATVRGDGSVCDSKKRVLLSSWNAIPAGGWTPAGRVR